MMSQERINYRTIAKQRKMKKALILTTQQANRDKCIHSNTNSILMVFTLLWKDKDQ